jgi:hypothetical protein
MSRRRDLGLRKLSSEALSKAREDTAAQVARILLTFAGISMFCLLSLLTPDSALMGGSERVSVPLAGPVSFSGFMLLGPAILIVLRVYLQIYVEHERRLEQVAARMALQRAPTLVPARNPLLRAFSWFTLYLGLPLMALAFTLKAAVFPIWSLRLLCLTSVIAVAHLLLPFRRIPWKRRARYGAVAGALVTITLITLYANDPPRRAFVLPRVTLTDQRLAGADFRSADLTLANLDGADLWSAQLANATLDRANLERANLVGANLSGANLYRARLGAANLELTKLDGANLKGANLASARNLTQRQIDKTCCDEATQLPPGLWRGRECWPWEINLGHP